MSQDYQYHRQSIRLPGYDYSQPGWYFVTICTFNREHVFGDILDGKMILNTFGKIVKAILVDMNNKFPINIEIHQIMPNHIHLVINIVGAIQESPIKPTNTSVLCFNSPKSINNIWAHRDAPLHRSLLSKMVGYLKMNSSKQIHLIDPNQPVWQRNYYEHVIRNESEYFAIKRYIQDNPTGWENDPLHN